MDKQLIPTHVEITFDEVHNDRGSYVIAVHKHTRSEDGRRQQEDRYSFRTPTRQGPNWNGERIAAFLDFLVNQFPADAALLDMIALGPDSEV